MEANEQMLEILNKMQAGQPRKPLKGAAKWLTLTILALIFGVGTFGSFEMANFDMDSFVLFLDSFKWFFGPLVISVGVGATAKTVTKVIAEKKQKVAEEKESV